MKHSSVAALDRAAESLLWIGLVLVPFAGVGVVALLGGAPLGTGLQPSFVPLGVAAALLLARNARTTRAHPDAWWLVVALGWTLLGSPGLWTLDDVGLAGEHPWSKGLKQLALLFVFVAMGVVPAVLVRCSEQPGEVLRRLERAASIGLGLAVLVGFAQAVHFHRPLPGLETLDAWLRSNPSIAAGSEELYLGHRFVGIPRLRGPFPEPLHFGSYLLAAAPVTLAVGFAHQGWSRTWRWFVGTAGLACLIGTFARGAYAGGGALALLLGVGMVRGRLPRPSTTAVWVTALVGGLAIATLSSLVTGGPPWELGELLVRRGLQAFAGHDMSNLTRLYAWGAALRLFGESPVLGAGWGSFGFHYFQLAGEGGSQAHFGWPVANSVPLLVLAETGIVGAALWARAVWPAFCGVLGHRREGSFPGEDRVRFGLAALCAAALVQTLTFSQWNLPHLWLLAGFSAGLGHGYGEPRQGVV